jgi:hypothetical protein
MINVYYFEKIRKEAIVFRWRYCLGIRLHKTRESLRKASVLASVGCRFRGFPQQQPASCVSDVMFSSLLQRVYTDAPQTCNFNPLSYRITQFKEKRN